MAENPDNPKLELPKPQRHITPEEAWRFLGLKNRSALNYLHSLPDGPPFILLTKRTRSYNLEDLQTWAQARKTSKH